MTENTPVPLNRIERTLAFMAAGVGGVAILSIAAYLIAALSGFRGFGTGAWPIVVVFPAIGLPIALVIMISFIVVRGLHQRRIARDGGN